MLDPTVVLARLVQYLAAAVLLGLPAFLLYGLKARGPGEQAWAARWLQAAAVVTGLGAVLALSAQTALMTGEPSAAADPAAWGAVLTGTQFGWALAARLALALAALLTPFVIRPGAGLWGVMTVLGAGVVASFAWTGHGAAGEGAAGLVQLVADVLHLWAASLWLGALAGMGAILIRLKATGLAGAQALHAALAGFSGVGTAMVVVLVLSGGVNSWYLVTLARLPQLFDTTYGVLLTLKLALFGVMLACAALNRFQHTPRLGAALAGDTSGAATALRGSLVLEALSGAGILVLVAILGTLPPPASM